MPEPVELRVRGGERRGVAMAEPDDGDAGEEIEVAAAGVVDQPRAVAFDERDVEARVGRKQCLIADALLSCDDRRSSDVGGDAAAGGDRRGAELGDDAAVEGARVEQALCLGDADRVDDVAVDVEARRRR